MLRLISAVLLVSALVGVTLPLGRAATTARSGSATHASAVACPPNTTRWGSYLAPSQHFRVWYRLGNAADKAAAKYLFGQMLTEIYPKETRLMERNPLSDAKAHNGPDGDLDICVMPTVTVQGSKDLVELRGATLPLETCDPTPTSVEIPLTYGGKELTDLQLRDSLAHEFFHVLQHTFDISCLSSKSYDWWREASATWAMDYVYPNDNLEHEFADQYLESSKQSLEVVPTPTKDDPNPPDPNRAYGAYLFADFLSHTPAPVGQGPSIIRKIWHADETESSLAAIRSAVGGAIALRNLWAKFAAFNWNGPPVDEYQLVDDLKAGESQLIHPITLTPGAAIGLDGVATLPHLSADYWSFTIGPGVRTIAFVNRPPYDGSDPNARVQAIITTPSGPTWDPVTWTGTQGKSFCLSVAGEHVTALTLVFSNSSITDDFAYSKVPGVIATNVGCHQWSGSVHMQRTDDGVTVKEDGTVTYRWDTNLPSDGVALQYDFVTGSAQWSVSGTDTFTGCSYSGSGNVTFPANDGEMEMFWSPAFTPGVYKPTAYWALGGGDDISPVTEACPGQAPFTTTMHVPAAIFTSTPPATQTVSTDGLTIQGDNSQTDGSETTTWSWDLTSSG